MANPNPTRISDPIWRLWTDFLAFEPTAKLSGVYADKPGYHNYRAALPSTDYSSGRDVANDKLGPSDKASAIDITLSTEKMKLYSKRLRDACVRRDSRLFKDGQPIIREFIGTLDGSTVYCYVLVGGQPLGVNGSYGPDPGRDTSHLWHIHISIIRKFINDWDAISGILSILKGEDENDMDYATFLSYYKKAITDDAVEMRDRAIAWQYVGGGIDAGYSTLKVFNEIHQTVKGLKEDVAALKAAPTATVAEATVTISDEQLERVLRKIIGSVDNTTPTA